MPYIIDGKAISKQIKDELRDEVEKLTEAGINACLAVIQVGNDPASTVYVNNKKKACAYVGINSRSYELPEDTSEQTFVDGFHPVSVGRLWIGEKGFLSCTPAGVIQLLKRSGIEIEGKECVIIGRSNIVGKPMAALLLRENATVTVAHSKTKDLKSIAKRADILIVAIGKAKFITKDYIKEGAVVIDVGMHRDEQNHLCGDVDCEDVSSVVSAITPVPGGVGPMTIAMLMNNCVETIRGREERA